jgi:hypothetical protein
VTTPPHSAALLRSGYPGGLPRGERLLLIFIASRPAPRRPSGVQERRGMTAARPGRESRREDGQKVLADLLARHG